MNLPPSTLAALIVPLAFVGFAAFYALAVALENRSPIRIGLYGKGIANAIAPHVKPAAVSMR